MKRRTFPRAEIKRLSLTIAERLLALHVGDVACPETWLPVLSALGCRVEPFYEVGGLSGEYAPTLESDGRGVVCYNTALTPPRQSLVLIHEAAHHLLWPHEQGVLFGEPAPEGYDDNPGDVRHKIARIVERIIRRGE